MIWESTSRPPWKVMERMVDDPMLASFIPTRYMGSSGGKCVNGYDQTSFVQAISSNVFNAAETDVVDKLVTVLQALDSNPGTGILAAQVPNPFKNISPGSFPDSKSDILSLGDGGEDGQEVPFQPLLVKARGVDVIIALDMVSCQSHACEGLPLTSVPNSRPMDQTECPVVAA